MQVDERFRERSAGGGPALDAVRTLPGERVDTPGGGRE